MEPLRVNLNSAELAQLERELRSEFGPSVISSGRAEELKEILALADKDIENHESEVDRLCGELRIVGAQKIKLETQRTKLRSLLSPIRKLPNETLFHILEYVCEENLFQDYPRDSYKSPPTRITSPFITYLPTMAISSVCSRWRELALSSPSLWANLKVELYVTRASLDGLIRTITQYLERSDDWPQ